MGNYSTIQFRNDLKKSEQIITQNIGVAPALFRAPYGMTSSIMFAELARENFIYVNWNEDPNDWDFKQEPRDILIKNVLKNARPNGVIVLHDGRDTKINYPRSNTISALPQIIKHLKNRGYTFITVDRLLNKNPYKN